MLRNVVVMLLVILLLAAGSAHAGVVAYYGPDGTLTAIGVPDANDPVSALNALVAGPSRYPTTEGFSTFIPNGTKVVDVSVAGDAVTVDFSPEILAGLVGEKELGSIYDQVKATLGFFGLDRSVKLTAGKVMLCDYLRPVEPITGRSLAVRAAEATTTTGSLSARSITLSPGHGLYWTGSTWTTQRSIACAGLTEEDYLNLDIATYLKSYLEADGMTVKMVRQTDKNAGNHPSGYPWWRMAAYLYLQSQGYPCSVYASYTGDCTTGSGSDESSDDVRARPLASNYDNTDIYISLHNNAYTGACTGTCPTGTETYYDLTSNEHKSYGAVSQTLANNVNSALMSAITQNVDSSWTCHGACTKDSAGNYGEIRIPQRAAILTELAFFDTCDRDALRLADPFFTSAAMWGMYKGVCDYFGVTPTWGFYSDEYVSDDIPASVAPGETREVHITFRNRGVVWNDARAIRLGAVDDSDPFSTATRYNISGNVAPGQTYTFTLSFTAPTTVGNYVTDWRMVRDGVTWFGPTLSKAIAVGGAPDTEAPSVPQNLTATAAGPNLVNLSWNASTDNVGVAGYKVYRDGAQIGTATITTTYADSSCASNTAYTYTVSAYDSSLNESAQSAGASVSTPPQTEYILDNTVAILTGSWSLGTGSVDKYGANYQYATVASSETATAIWRPTLDVAGYYDVYAWWPQGSNRTTAAPYTIYWNGGSQTVTMTQQVNGGQWNLLTSSKPFSAGNAGYVKLGNGTGEASLVVMADAVRFVKVAADTTPPVISGVASSPSQTACTVAWTTDESSTSRVEYGKTTAYGSLTTLNTSMVTSHSVGLSGLSRRTTYHYRVRSADAAGNEAISGDYTFKTK